MPRTIPLIFSVLVIFGLLLSACAPAATPTQAVQQPTTAAQQPANTMAPEATATTAAVAPEATATTAAAAPDATATTAAAANANSLPEIDPSTVKGNVTTAGSSTVYPLSEAVVNLFESEGYTGQVTVESIGTGAGFERFCKGETDVSNASRKIKDSEVETCKSNGIEPVEFRIGTDAIAVVVNPQNDFLTNVTKDELAMIFSDQSELWSDVNSAWPAEPIKRYTPGTDSGTYDFFIEGILQPKYDKDAKKAKEAFQNAQNLQQSEDDNVLVQGIEGDQYAIGFFGFAYYQEEGSKLKLLTIEEVTPSFESAESGEYALARPLFIYSGAKILQEKPQVADFITFYLTRINEVIADVGYFPASDEALNEAGQNLLNATAP